MEVCKGRGIQNELSLTEMLESDRDLVFLANRKKEKEIWWSLGDFETFFIFRIVIIINL